MRIALVIRMYQEQNFHGGGEKLFYNLIKRLKNDGHIVDIYCSSSGENSGSFSENFSVNVINEHYDHNKPETMERFYNKVSEIIKDKGYDLVISENITPPLGITFLQGHSLVNRLKKNKNPLEAFLYNFRKTKRERINFQEKWIKQGYKKIFTVSEILKQDIVENFGVSPDNIAVIHPGVELPEGNAQRLNAQPPQQVRGDILLVHGDKVVFGLLAPGFNIKGGFVFLKALALLKKKGYEFRAKIVYPKYKKNLGVKLLVRLYGIDKNVEFLGYQKDIAAFYSSINCLVAPSLEDTFNLAVLEAMAHFRPVIVSNYAGAFEIIDEGKNGFVFDIKKDGADNLAEKMEYYLVHKCTLQENARKTAEEYSWDRFYKRFMEEVRKLETKKCN